MSANPKTPYNLNGKRVWVAGHRGMVGSAIVRRLAEESCTILAVGREEVDLRRQAEVEAWLNENKPDAVFVASAKVGGIHANSTYPADFLYDNLVIETNIIHGAHMAGVEKLLFLGSSCIYPKLAPQPLKEDMLLTGPLEPTNEWYAVAKIAGIKMCQAYRRQHGRHYIAAMPTNLYGPNDNYDLEKGHVPAAMIAKCHMAKIAGAPEVEAWGTGTPLREFMSVDDCADALVFMMKNYDGEAFLNVGTGEETSIREFAETVAEVVGFEGRFRFDTSKPDGTPRKVMDSSVLRGMGWAPRLGLKEGLRQAYRWYLENIADS